jgi:E3 ubiquitin-protein ligase UBR4
VCSHFAQTRAVGVLAEDLLKQNVSSKVASAIEEVREKTKSEKKKLAMAIRKKQLNQLGMKTNEKGQLIKVDQSTLKNLTDEVIIYSS